MKFQLKPIWKGCWVLLGLLLWSGCQNANSQLKLIIMETSAHSGLQSAGTSFFVITDRQAFADLYNRAHSLKTPKPDLPEIDFENQLVLVAFMGLKSTGGYGIVFNDSVSESGDTLKVTVQFQEPPQGAILPQVITSPYVMATVDRGQFKQIQFIDSKGNTLAVKAVD